ncbi:MAG: tripartite tricarboxylate transporter permease [Acetobacterales bacterium]
MVDNLILGFGTALSLENLAYCLAGTVLGTMIGILPGLGPAATIAILLPFTYGLPAEGALIMLAGIFYGAQYGGSTTAILVNLPGESSSMITCIDGHEMARRGRAGPALAIAAFGSLFAGCLGTLFVAVLGPMLARWALAFGPAEYFSLMVLGLVAAAMLSSGSQLRAIGMIFVGLLLGCVGTEVATGTARYSFGFYELVDGVSFVVVAMGIFGLSEIVLNLQQPGESSLLREKIGRIMPSRDELRRSVGPILRGTGIGAIVGAIPGAGATIASFASYAVERKLSRTPERFGQGAIEGVAAPESANNASAQTSFIPTLALGLPGSGTMALMLGALLIQGIAPGPMVATRHPEVFWGLIASMWIGNVFLVLLNLPLVGLWVRFLSIPYKYLFPAILLFCSIGVYSIRNNPFDVVLMVVFGMFGYLLRWLGCQPAPMLLGLILGPMMEENIRRALVISRGDATVLVTQPLSLAMLVAAGLLLLVVIFPTIKRAAYAFR